MKTKLATVMALLIAISASGCKDTQEIAKEMEASLGIPVQLKAGKDDACVEAQVRGLANDYEALSQGERQIVANTLRSRFTAVEFAPTAITQIVKGNLIRLELYNPGSDRWPAHSVDVKTLLDERTAIGTSPATQVEKVEAGKAVTLKITTQATLQNYRLRQYRTIDGTIYNLISSMEDLNRALETYAGKRIGWYTHNVSDMECAPPARLSDLLP